MNPSFRARGRERQREYENSDHHGVKGNFLMPDTVDNLMNRLWLREAASLIVIWKADDDSHLCIVKKPFLYIVGKGMCSHRFP